MATDTLSKDIGVWQAAVTNVKARLPELSQLEPTVKELEGVIVEGEQIQSIQDVQRSDLRETTRRSLEIRAAGAASATSWPRVCRASSESTAWRCWPSA